MVAQSMTEEVKKVAASRPGRWLVCGSRQYGEVDYIFDQLDILSELRGPPGVLMHGGAQGVDKIAGWWADRRRVPKQVYAPEWRQHGKAAGPMRNQRMLDEGKPTLVIAFRGGAGTADMIERAVRAGVEVVRIGDGSPLLGA
jgi:hypothetical protein